MVKPAPAAQETARIVQAKTTHVLTLEYLANRVNMVLSEFLLFLRGG
jgi:hypothetical protein